VGVRPEWPEGMGEGHGTPGNAEGGGHWDKEMGREVGRPEGTECERTRDLLRATLGKVGLESQEGVKRRQSGWVCSLAVSLSAPSESLSWLLYRRRSPEDPWIPIRNTPLFIGSSQ
jgi:hypothetical protein